MFSRFFDVVENAAAGVDLRVTITTALKDPDSMNGEEERYSVDNVALDSLPLVNYATGKVKISYAAAPFMSPVFRCNLTIP